jgi:hypothetical protein
MVQVVLHMVQQWFRSSAHGSAMVQEFCTWFRNGSGSSAHGSAIVQEFCTWFSNSSGSSSAYTAEVNFLVLIAMVQLVQE